MAKFPTSVWDGFTGNPLRKDSFENSAPDNKDWNLLVAELRAMQTVLVPSLRAFHFARAAGDIADATTNAGGWVRLIGSGRLTSITVMLETAPVGQSAIFDLLASTDNGATFTTLWASSGDRVAVPAASHVGSAIAFDTHEFPSGTIFRLDVIQAGSGTAGAGLTAVLGFNLSLL